MKCQDLFFAKMKIPQKLLSAFIMTGTLWVNNKTEGSEKSLDRVMAAEK